MDYVMYTYIEDVAERLMQQNTNIRSCSTLDRQGKQF